MLMDSFYGTNSKKAYSDILIEGNEVYNLKLGRRGSCPKWKY